MGFARMVNQICINRRHHVSLEDFSAKLFKKVLLNVEHIIIIKLKSTSSLCCVMLYWQTMAKSEALRCVLKQDTLSSA